METKLKCILLIDDDPNDILFHTRAIERANAAELVIAKQSVAEALEFLTDESAEREIRPDLIFVDINMQEVNGWEFIDRYEKLERKTEAGPVIVMLSASSNPEDESRAQRSASVSNILTKPLTKETVEEIVRTCLAKNPGP